MPRKNRRDSGTGYFHIVVQGNNKGYIFHKDHTKSTYSCILWKYSEAYKISISGWCFMSNHVHLLVCGGSADVSEWMKVVNHKFTMTYHRSHNTSGHIFQGRFFCAPIDEESYLKRVLRYIHMNPVKAGIVLAVEDYNWSSYNNYLENKRSSELQDVYDLFQNEMHYKYYHKLQDYHEYMDCDEDIKRNRDQVIKEIVNMHLAKFRENSVEAGIRDGLQKRSLILALGKLSWISLRDISRTVGVATYEVKKILESKCADG